MTIDSHLDDLSDLEVSLLLSDDLWQSEGGHLQLLLCQLPQFAPREGQEFIVQPVSSLGPLRCFLQDGATVPWEGLSSDENVDGCIVIAQAFVTQTGR